MKFKWSNKYQNEVQMKFRMKFKWSYKYQKNNLLAKFLLWMSILVISCRRNLFFGSDPKWAAFWDLWYFFNKWKRRFRIDVARPSTSATKMVNVIIIRKMNPCIFKSSFIFYKVKYIKLQWSCCEVAFIPRLWYHRTITANEHSPL